MSADRMSFLEEATHPRCACEGCPDRPGRASRKEGESWGDHSEAFVGIDTSKLRNAVAIAEGGRGGEVRYLGEIDNTRGGDAQAGGEAGGQVSPADVLLRGRSDRLRALPADQEPRSRRASWWRRR